MDLDQPGRTTKMVKMKDVAYVPGLSLNLLSTVKAVEQWGKPLIYYRNKTVLGFQGEESLVFKFCPRRGLFSATCARRIPRQKAALEANLTENGLVKIASGAALRASASRDVMEVHRMLAHPSEDITRKTAVMMGIEMTGQWGACETWFQVKVKRHAVPKKTDERASVRRQRFFVDVGGPMKHSSLGGNSYVVIFVDDCTRFKVVKFLKKKNDTTAALLSLIADYITPQKLSIKCIRTDNGGKFEGEFQRELDRRSITHEHTPPDTPQYDGVAERALGLLREKAIILMEELDDVINVPRKKLWAQAMLFACDVTNKSVTTLTDGGKLPYELWFANFPTADHLRPFGAVGYARQSVREHKMAPKGEKCVYRRIPRNFPTGTVSVLLVRSRNIVERQAVQWIDGPKKTGGDGTGSDDRGMKSAGDGIIVERGTPQLNVQELGQEQQLTLHGHETQEALSELEGVTQGALSEHEEETQEALSENEREQQHEEGGAEPALGLANLEGPALPALRKLTIDGNIPPILSSRTRSRRPHTGVEGEVLHCFLPAIEAEEENGVEDALAYDDGGQMTMQATLDISEPRNRRQAMERNGTNGGRQRRLRCLELSKTALIGRWPGRRISSWSARKCYTSEKSDRTARSRSTSVDLSLKGSGRWKVCTTRKSTCPRQQPRQSGCFWRWQRPRTESCAISTQSRHF